MIEAMNDSMSRRELLKTSGRIAAATALAGVIIPQHVHAAENNTIQVTGSAKRRIRSDLIIWDAKVSARGNEMSAAYKALAASVPRVTAYLEKKGIPRKSIVVSSVTTTALHPRDHEGRVAGRQPAE